jgi:hypothetical protein
VSGALHRCLEDIGRFCPFNDDYELVDIADFKGLGLVVPISMDVVGEDLDAMNSGLEIRRHITRP